MKSIPDVAGEARRAWLFEMQCHQRAPQSDFECCLAYRLCFIVAVFVIGLNLLSPDPTPSPPARAAVRHTV